MSKVLSELRKTIYRSSSFYKHGDLLKNIKEIKEYDLDSVTRYAIDKHIRVGCWYQIIKESDVEGIECLNREDRPKLRTLSFDIECFKELLLFPDANKDEIFLISITDEKDESILITNKKFVPKHIEDFTYKSPGEIVTAKLMSSFIRILKTI